MPKLPDCMYCDRPIKRGHKWYYLSEGGNVGHINCRDPESYVTGEREQLKEAYEKLADLRAKLDEALRRMDRARDILTEGAPTLKWTWGILDTSDLRALKEQEKKG